MSIDAQAFVPTNVQAASFMPPPQNGSAPQQTTQGTGGQETLTELPKMPMPTGLMPAASGSGSSKAEEATDP